MRERVFSIHLNSLKETNWEGRLHVKEAIKSAEGRAWIAQRLQEGVSVSDLDASLGPCPWPEQKYAKEKYPSIQQGSIQERRAEGQPEMAPIPLRWVGDNAKGAEFAFKIENGRCFYLEAPVQVDFEPTFENLAPYVTKVLNLAAPIEGSGGFVSLVEIKGEVVKVWS